MTTPTTRGRRIPARTLKSPLAAPGQATQADVTRAASALTAAVQSPLTDRESTLAEFEGYLRTVNNRDGRPYEEKTISVYSVPAKNLDGWLTANGIDRDFTVVDTALLNRYFREYYLEHGQGGTHTLQRNLIQLFNFLERERGFASPYTDGLNRYAAVKGRPKTLSAEFVDDLLDTPVTARSDRTHRIPLLGSRTPPGGARTPGGSPARPPWAAAVTIPAGQQAEGPSIARIYDYLLGGSHNFAADEEAATTFLARWPDARETMRANRAFLGRAVRYLAGQAGIRQFLDIGSGIPTMGNVHEIAQQTAPDARVVYVDNEEVAILHSRAILARNQNATAIQADLRRPAEILGSPQLLGLLDVSQPVALLLVAVLHFFPDSDQPAALVAELRDALAPGSYVVISHGTTDGQAPHVAEAMGHYNQTTAPFRPRRRAEVMAFFDGLEMVDPGLLPVPLWRPDQPGDASDLPMQIAAYGGAGCKP